VTPALGCVLAATCPGRSLPKSVAGLSTSCRR
jgi:hypothetical protein